MVKREENAMCFSRLFWCKCLWWLIILSPCSLTAASCVRTLFPLGRMCRQLNTPPPSSVRCGALIAFHSDTFFNFRPSALHQPSVRPFQHPGGVWMREGIIKINYENINSGVIINSFHFSSVWQVFIFPTDNWSIHSFSEFKCWCF